MCIPQTKLKGRKAKHQKIFHADLSIFFQNPMMKTTTTEQNSFKWLFFTLHVSEPCLGVSVPEECIAFSASPSLSLYLSVFISTSLLPCPLSLHSLPCQKVSINPPDWACPIKPSCCWPLTLTQNHPAHYPPPTLHHDHRLISIADHLRVIISGRLTSQPTSSMDHVSASWRSWLGSN